MSDRYRRGGPGPGPGSRDRGPKRGPRPGDDEFEGEEGYADESWEDEPRDEPPPRRAAPPRRGSPPRRPGPRERSGGRGPFGPRSGVRRGSARGERFDWGVADEDDERYGYDEGPDEGDYGDEEGWDESPRRSRRPSRSPRRPARRTLMDLATPVFAFAAVLPRDPMGVQPAYGQFRQEVLAALNRVESEAHENRIETEDAKAAVYALAMFMDEQVAGSEWTGKGQWATEPLSVALLQDPQGGVNFFTRLESLGDRQKAVKEVYLVCLAMGFRGKYVELDPTQQATRIGEIRQKVVRSIYPVPLDSQEVLFPEAYEPAAPLEDQAPPPPRWWVAASIGGVVLALLVYVLLFWAAGRLPGRAESRVQQLQSASALDPGGGSRTALASARAAEEGR